MEILIGLGVVLVVAGFLLLIRHRKKEQIKKNTLPIFKSVAPPPCKKMVYGINPNRVTSTKRKEDTTTLSDNNYFVPF